METSKYNKIVIEAIKNVKEVHWVGNTKHNTLDKCLVAINLYQRVNSGWYTPKPIKIKGYKGYFVVNEDGRIGFESRILKISNNEFLIEHLSSDGYKTFEDNYYKLV